MLKTLRKTSSILNECYCCGNETDNIVPAIGTYLYFALCPMCEGAGLKFIDGYWQISCPFHGHPDIKGMVHYWNAIDKYNERFGTKLKGKRVKLGINWEKETENLRKKWKGMLEK